MSNDWRESSNLERLLNEIQAVASQDHIPEEVLRAYLAQEEIEEEIEQHLIDCTDCQTLADGILAETSPWQDDSEHIQQLKADVLSRAQAISPVYLQRLQTALEKLAAAREDLRAALTAWREGLIRGYLGAEATVRANLSGQRGLSVLQELSGRGLTVASVGAQRRVRGAGGTEGEEGASSVGFSTDRLSGAQVRIDEHAIEVIFLDWNGPVPPLIILLPETDADEARATVGREDSDTGMFVARFEGVTPGSFLVTIASPTEDSSM